ncbi:16830_t:CDS:2 [Cetraspora pellucida]|uniref:16830_t:CDS:1 n=1 Tax=Cetraspora pellucida TaxID=1433469 RepID=A0A9N9D1K4_9GLOM|nr:16830_t:CDS:2 [Cetraspora pellucida]
MHQNLAIEESLGFKYLVLFKEEYREKAAEELGANPTDESYINALSPIQKKMDG